MAEKPERAIRAEMDAGGDALVSAIVRESGELGLLGWVRSDADAFRIHAEGAASAVERLIGFLGDEAAGRKLTTDDVKPEGHEQFAIRGVSAGEFVVQEHRARSHHFDLRLEVEGVMRSWAVPKGPSMDPATKRMAIQVDDHDKEHNRFEGETEGGSVIVWDRGSYEQGGRVPWPQALERGHAVFVLHGEKLRGGFALQRTRGGAKARWLLIKRVDEEAKPRSNVVAESPGSVL